MFEFIWPWIFVLAPLPLLIYFFVPEKKGNQSAALRVPTSHAFGMLSSGPVAKSSLTLIPVFIIWLLLVTAAARPQWLGEPIAIPTQGRDLMVAVDLSGSMKARDMEVRGQPVNRLSMIKYVLSDFINRRVGDRLGLILFADTAYLQAPLTYDRKTVETLLNESVIGLVGENTAIGDAIGLAVKRFREREKSNRVLILLTDGRNTAGNITPEQALNLAKENQVTIYTIGVGSNTRSMFGFSAPSSGSDFDEATLKMVAEETGGAFFKANDTESLINIYRQLDELEPIEAGNEKMRPQTALYYYPLAAALLLSIVITLFSIFVGMRKTEEAA
ncbi:vWA domain-containing protein [Glaciecola sp. 1036]|uniref:vWA domain-containing protein n=1 Tax=Alteromonadaceae TaxID=72275 RepID=UPI003CFFE818